MADNELEKAVLDNHLVFGLIDLGPVFFINGRVYYCLESSDPNTENFLIKEGPRIDVLEKISNEILKPNYERFKRSFLEESIKNISQNFNDGSNKLLNFVLDGIFPYLRKDTLVLGELLDLKVNDELIEKKERTIDDKTKEYIDKRKKALREEIHTLKDYENISISPKFDSAILDLVNNYNCAIFDQNLFLLRDTKDEKSNVSIGGKGYNFIKSIALKDFKRYFVDNISNNLKIEVFEEGNNDVLYSKLEDKLAKGDLINSGNTYEEEDFGFIKKPGQMFVYVVVPDYVLKSPTNNDYFKFDSHKIGIDISLDSNFPRLMNYPHTIENVEGPFYRIGERALCMGNYDYNFIDRFKDKGEAFAKLLVDARNVTLRGYGNYGGTPHRVLDRNNFFHRLISYEEAKKIGITNINTQTKKWMN